MSTATRRKGDVLVGDRGFCSFLHLDYSNGPEGTNKAINTQIIRNLLQQTYHDMFSQ